MAALIQTIYASDALTTFKEHEIPDLLRQIRPANAKAQITGLLIYVGHSFLQVLEGPAGAVDGLFARIKFDNRHSQITRLTRQPLAERQFADWTMDFSAIHPVDVAQTTGILNFAEHGSCTRLDPCAAEKLVGALRRPSWNYGDRQVSPTRRVG